jgi:ABC-type lipoprotein release transport system permease subunit
VPPIDPVTLLVMPALFMAIAGLASLASARRATRIDPVIALRNE